MKKSKKKKFNKRLARKKLHILWSRVIRERDDYICQWCLHDGKVNANLKHHAHHIVSRSLSGTSGAYEVINGFTLCYRCHLFRIRSEVDEYIEFRDMWLSDNVGINYQSLREKYYEITKFTEEFYLKKQQEIDEGGPFLTPS